MNRTLAQQLFVELQKHAEIVTANHSLFDLLVSSEIPESSRFYEPLPDTPQLVQEEGCYHHLSLRRILRNRYVRHAQPSSWKRACEATAAFLGIYSSDVLTRDLQANALLVETMTQCPHPFSLLGKLQSYNFDNEDGPLFVITRPVLVIPGTTDMEPVYAWERRNTRYEQEVRMLGVFLRQKRIRPEEYLSR